jgi:hypothetical protein
LTSKKRSECRAWYFRRVRIALAWVVGTALFALGMVLADRGFWAQCNGLPTSRYGEVWICSNMLAVRIGVAALAGIAAGLLARRRALALGALVGLAGIAAVSAAYRPMLAFTQPLAVLNGFLYFVLPTMVAATLATLSFGKRPS